MRIDVQKYAVGGNQNTKPESAAKKQIKQLENQKKQLNIQIDELKRDKNSDPKLREEKIKDLQKRIEEINKQIQTLHTQNTEATASDENIEEKKEEAGNTKQEKQENSRIVPTKRAFDLYIDSKSQGTEESAAKRQRTTKAEEEKGKFHTLL